MPVYNWENLEETKITPSRTTAIGKTVKTDYMLLQKIVYEEDRGDGKGAGAQPHSHPEEQIVMPIEGTMKVRIKDEWFEVGPGDIIVLPANVEHEQVVEDRLVWLNVKLRVPGHSVFDGGWLPGSKKDWGKLIDHYKEMDKKYKGSAPWDRE